MNVDVPEEVLKPKPAAKKRFGSLKIAVEPWGEVYVDGKNLGYTPLSAIKIVEGSHLIRIVNPRFNKEKRLRVVIRANEDTLVQQKF